MLEVNIATRTNGIGFWTACRKKVKIIGLELEGNELRAYFNPQDWDIYEHGDICTDEGWIESFSKEIISICPHIDGIEYAPYSSQTDVYVALIVPHNFTLEY